MRWDRRKTTMKLWHLKGTEKGVEEAPMYDIADEFVIREATEERAREAAGSSCGDEGRNFWLNPDLSACNELLPEGELGVVVRSFRAG
jgi:hypothetical protein